MSVDLADPRIAPAVNMDPEFRIMARECNMTVAFGVGSDWFLYTFRDGQLESTKAGVTIFDSSDFAISGSVESWQKLLSPIPPPLFTDIWPALLHGNMRSNGDLETMFAYWPALRRVWDVVRELDITKGA